jgi:quercetin dioxygenase-like cupin family protein
MEIFIDTAGIHEKMLQPGIFAKLVHTDTMSIAHVRLEKDAILPVHHHPHEQVTNVLSGELEMTIGNEAPRVFGPGQVAILRSNVPHGARALTDCLVIDVFNPVREDYK